MTKIPKKQNSAHDEDGEKSQILNVANLHYHGNDLKELRKLAKINPDLAYKVLESENEKDRRFNVSFRFGLILTSILLITAITGVLTAIYLSGWTTTLLMICFVLAIALLVRVILTGKWSDTSWIGKTVNLLSKALGSKADNELDDD